MPDLRALIADDEPLARERLQRLLARQGGVEVVGQCGSGRELPRLVAAVEPDVVFLDVQMPGGSGFEALAALPRGERPAVVFVTAFDEHAVRAFEVNAVDYQLKPVTRERLGEALERVRARAREPDIDLRRLGVDLAAGAPLLERLVVRQGERSSLVDVADVDWIAAEGNYARVHARGRAHLLRETLRALEARLDPQRFFRLHKGSIVNLARVKELRPLFHGSYEVLLHDGTRLRLSRRCRRKLEERLGARL